jgi:hypothetical protein
MLLTLLPIAVLVPRYSSSHAAHPTADCSVGAALFLVACCSPFADCSVGAALLLVFLLAALYTIELPSTLQCHSGI